MSKRKPRFKKKRKIGRDFDVGMRAFELGDYATALCQFAPKRYKNMNDGGYVEILVEGKKVLATSTMAVKEIRLAAEMGVGTVQCKFGFMYYNGICVNKDYSQAMLWYLRSAKQGDLDAFIHLVRMHDRGEGMSADEAEEEDEFDRDVAWRYNDYEQDDAHYSCGFMYYHGIGVLQDHNKARDSFRLVEETCDDVFCEADASSYLAMIHDRDEGKSEDELDDEEDMEFELYDDEVEANKGDASAQQKVGWIYHFGNPGVAVDVVLGYKWATLAAAQGNAEAEEDKAIMAKDMTPAQIDEAEKLASEFVPTDEDVNEIK